GVAENPTDGPVGQWNEPEDGMPDRHDAGDARSWRDDQVERQRDGIGELSGRRSVEDPDPGLECEQRPDAFFAALKVRCPRYSLPANPKSASTRTSASFIGSPRPVTTLPVSRSSGCATTAAAIVSAASAVNLNARCRME